MLLLHDNHRHQNPFFCIHLNGTNQINILVSNGQMWIIMMKMTFCTHSPASTQSYSRTLLQEGLSSFYLGNSKLCIQLGEYQKDLEYKLHHRLSKFYRSAFLNLKPIYYFFGIYMAWFLLSRNYWRQLDHDLIEFRSQLSYYSCTEKVQSDFRFKLAKTRWQFRQLFLKFDTKYKVSKKYFWTK